jgi:hypothetical protein
MQKWRKEKPVSLGLSSTNLHDLRPSLLLAEPDDQSIRIPELNDFARRGSGSTTVSISKLPDNSAFKICMW